MLKLILTCNAPPNVSHLVKPKTKANDLAQNVRKESRDEKSLLMANNVGSHSHKRRSNKTTHRSNSVLNSDMTTTTLSPPSPYKWVARVGAAAAILLTLILLFGISSNTWSASPHDSLKIQLPPFFTVEIVNEFPHDPNAFTQGLLYWGNDTFYESTGLYGQSTVRKVDLHTGKVETQRSMDKALFGEGLTLIGERLYQVTWLRNAGFIYERENFNNVTTFTHHMKDGWGLATDGKTLFGSDGSSTLYQMDPQTMKVIQKQTVTYEGREVRYLNELEYINGEVWANIFMTDCIVRLTPGGNVAGWIILSNLREALINAGETNFDVLNGIAWDSEKQRIFVTGKLWPKLYEIKLHPVKENSQVDVHQHCIPNVQIQF